MIPDLAAPAITSGTARSGLRWRILGTIQPTLIVDIDNDHALTSDSGGMSWMTSSVEMTTNMPGGFLGGLARALGGSTMFLLGFKTAFQGQVAFAADFPGKLIPMELGVDETVMMHRHAFVCCDTSIQLETSFTRSIGAGLVGGDGFVLQKLTGPGMAWAQVDGDGIEYRLKADETLLVEPGHVAMFDASVTFETEMVKGLKNALFSGEALFFAKLTGPGRLWLNSMSMSKVAQRVGEYLPSSSS